MGAKLNWANQGVGEAPLKAGAGTKAAAVPVVTQAISASVCVAQPGSRNIYSTTATTTKLASTYRMYVWVVGGWMK